MPVIRTEILKRKPVDTSSPTTLNLASFKYVTKAERNSTFVSEDGEGECENGLSTFVKRASPVDLALQSKGNIYFPTAEEERQTFKTEGGKKVTAHQWAVYDITRKIPCGKVTTYKDLCTLLGEGSPRSIGNALRHNPFAPFVPCHRIVSSDLKLGGFCGEWGTEGQEGSKCSKKVQMLAEEGVYFSGKGVLEDKKTMLWNVKDL